MPVRLSASDKKLLMTGAAVFVLLIGTAALLGGGEDPDEEGSPTTYSYGSNGARAAYTLLQEMGYRVERWERPLQELPEPAGKLLILLEPSQFVNMQDRKKLATFVQNGGRVLASGWIAASFFPDSQASPSTPGSKLWHKYPALMPSAITRDVPFVTMADRSWWDANHAAVAFYGENNKAVVVRQKIGKGELMWWGAATPLTNSGLKEPGNLEFFLSCVGDKDGVQVLWDESLHGYSRSLGHAAAKSNLRWVLWQLVALGVLVVLAYSRRSGPVRAMAAESRLSPLEFVDTLGNLYRHADAASVAVDVYYQRFRYWITRRLGVAIDCKAEELDRAVRSRWGLDDPAFLTTLKDCEAVRYRTDLADKQALPLVQKLYDYAVQLKIFPGPGKERTSWKR